MKVIKNSWHHQLYTFLNVKGTLATETNLCEYTRGVFIGLFFVLLISLVLSLVFLALLEPIITFIAYTITGLLIISIFGEAVTIVSVFLYAMIFLFGSIHLIRKIPRTNINLPENSFYYVAKAAIKDKHDKVCRLIEIGD